MFEQILIVTSNNLLLDLQGVRLFLTNNGITVRDFDEINTNRVIYKISKISKDIQKEIEERFNSKVEVYNKDATE